MSEVVLHEVDGRLPAARYPDALVECYARYSAALVGYLVPLVGDSGIAQDLAQEAFVDLFSRWRKVEHPRAYVYAAATNLARGHWRRREREGRALASVEALAQHSRRDEEPWLRDLVLRLPERLRAPVLLHYYADLPMHEVATQLRLPLGTVKRRLHEARAMLLHVLEECDA